MDPSLKEAFAQLGPIQAISQSPSGSPVLLRITHVMPLSKLRSIDAILALRQAGLPMLKAKRAIEAVMETGAALARPPLVENLAALLAALAGAGFPAAMMDVAIEPDVSALRTRLALTREQFALRYGLNVENLRNWEDGRRPLDSTARSYLTAIANDPHGIPLPYTPLTPPKD
jgi:putative transcriptional regulator